MKSSTIGIDIYTKGVATDTESRRITSLKSRRRAWKYYILSLVLSDLIMMGIAYRLAYFIRFELNLEIFALHIVPSKVIYTGLVFILIPFWLITFTAVGMYGRDNLLGGTDEYALIFRACTVSLLLVILASFLEPAFIIARGWLLMAWFISIVFLATGRFSLRRAVYYLRRNGYFQSNALIVGANNEGLSLAEQLITWPTSGLKMVGFVDKKLKPGTRLENGLKVLGTVEQLDDIIAEYQVEELILATSAISSRDKLLDIFSDYANSDYINIRMSSGLYEIITTGLTVHEFAYVPLVGVNKVRLSETDKIVKSLLEYSIIIPGLLLAAPLLLLIALAVKLDSPGPVIYRHRVMGVKGKEFDAFKFRTMYINGDEILAKYPDLKRELDRNHKLKDDPRVTRLGRFLRRYSLDELPQLINVLKADMALIGPRFIAPKEMENYNHWGINLLTVRPGLTGLWQVSGRSDISYQERVNLDMYYIRNWSIWLDLQLLFRTIPVVLKGKGAY
jgi:exopolysaccharide biosynthesis polyprenyl glycosylphosphotransferase